jgi:hypothetical protein
LCVPADVAELIGVPVEALAKTGEGIINGDAGERGVNSWRVTGAQWIGKRIIAKIGNN